MFSLYGPDTIEYPVEREEDVRRYLEGEFGPVCKEHGGVLANGNVWAYFTFQLGSGYAPCFQGGALSDLSRIEREKRDPESLYLWM